MREKPRSGCEGQEKAEVLDFLRMIPLRIAQTVQSVCCDLWEAYTEAAREVLSWARIVADRFHVARHYRDAVDEVRKREQHRLKKELSKAEYEKLNGSYRAFRKNAEDLNKEERKVLRRFFKQSASAKQAYLLREQLTAIFNMNVSKKQAQSKIRGWIQKVHNSGLKCYENFLKLLGNWWEEITKLQHPAARIVALCGRIQRQQGQDPQTALLRHFPSQSSIPAYLPGLEWLPIICHHHIWLNHGNSQ